MLGGGGESWGEQQQPSTNGRARALSKVKVALMQEKEPIDCCLRSRVVSCHVVCRRVVCLWWWCGVLDLVCFGLLGLDWIGLDLMLLLLQQPACLLLGASFVFATAPPFFFWVFVV